MSVNSADYGRLSEQLTRDGLKLKFIDMDGNCMFRAVSDQLEGNPERHALYRRATVEFMKVCVCVFFIVL